MKKKLPAKLTPEQRYDISMIGECIAEGGCGVYVDSYAKSNKGIFVLGVEAPNGPRFYEVKVKPLKKHKSAYSDDTQQ
jgi:hypothetical protein